MSHTKITDVLQRVEKGIEGEAARNTFGTSEECIEYSVVKAEALQNPGQFEWRSMSKVLHSAKITFGRKPRGERL